MTPETIIFIISGLALLFALLGFAQLYKAKMYQKELLEIQRKQLQTPAPPDYLPFTRAYWVNPSKTYSEDDLSSDDEIMNS